MSWMRSVKQKCSRHMANSKATDDTEVLFKLLVVDSTCALNASRARSSLTHKHTHMTAPKKLWNVSVAWISVDPEAGMLSGISRKRSIRSNPYWFTEFCNSQCLSHFAAPFIVVRAETSVAESCVWCNKVDSHPEQYTVTYAFQQTMVASQQRKTVQCCSTTREAKHEEAAARPHPRTVIHK